ncbi:hypothetical protein ABDK00_003610 [Niabella insulamsoli]|uniref:hypothetical protein n=1 Tax=Niabella insulamsoli TaxID=3144874 RepID=UPI0031FCABC7
MNTKIQCYALILTLALIGCGGKIQRASHFTLESIQPGMSKEAVIAAVGKPYKQSFTYASDSATLETYYYKEIIWKKNWFEINNLVHFKNGILTSLEQGNEKHLYNSSTVQPDL